MAKRILFVDDEPSVLTLLQALARRIGPEWDTAFADSGTRALELMAEQPFDVVVSDMRMPGMSGLELLHQVMERYPKTARVILSGYADQESILSSLGVTHQFLAKPCEIVVLRRTIARILSLDRLLREDRLKAVAARMQALPTPPSLYFALMKEMASPNATTDTIAGLIEEDVSLTAKLLQLVNAPFFGVAHPVTGAAEAVQILGFSAIKTLTLSIYVFARFESEQYPDFPVDRLWNHSLATGMRARVVAEALGSNPETQDAAFTAGILHDVGKLVLASRLQDLYRAALSLAEHGPRNQWEAEKEIIGAHHGELGAYLLGLWGLPANIVEAVAWHHQPGECESKEIGALTAVHLANALEHASTLAPTPPSGGENALIDRPYLQELGLSDAVALLTSAAKRT